MYFLYETILVLILIIPVNHQKSENLALFNFMKKMQKEFILIFYIDETLLLKKQKPSKLTFSSKIKEKQNGNLEI